MWGTGLVTIDQADNISIHFKTYITPFITDTYNFTLVSDAGNMWNFDGYIANNNINPVGKQTYYYNNVLLNAFQTYKILIDFADWAVNTEIQLYWKTSTVSNQTIPAENLSIPYDASSSPYQVTVNCPTGYTVGGSAMNQCITYCGDGLVYGSEKWDDSNNANEDGWSSDWTAIENGWIWLNGSTTHKSEWSKWDSGYQSNSNHTQWEVSNTSNEVTITEAVTSLIIAVTALSNVVSLIKSQSSIQSTFSGLNQLQLILLLPLTGAFIPSKVVQFISGMNFAINIMSYANISYLYPQELQKLSYDQSSSYLYLINIKDGSSIFNWLNFAFPVLFLLWIHWLLLFIKWIIRRVNERRWIKRLVLKLIEWFTFAIYIRMIFQYYLFLLIASLSELYFFRFNNTDHLISKIFSSILLLIWNIIIVLWVCLIFSTKIIEDGELQFKRRRCIHWFSGLKERRISRFYTLLFFLRRQLFWVLILLFKDIKMIVKLSVYSLMQLVYIVILWFHRPFKYSKELIIDLINEFVYLSLWVLLIHFNTENAWNSVTQNLYIWIIIGNNIVLLIFEIVFCFKWKSNFLIFILLLYNN